MNDGKTSDFERTLWGVLELEGSGPYPCADCGTPLELPGICDGCGAKRERAASQRNCAKALSTLPSGLSWARLDNEALLRAVGPDRRPRVEPSLHTGADPIGWCRHAVGALISGKARNIVLMGPTGVGKSALACAMARRVVEVDPAVGARMRFVSCVDLSTCRREARWGEGRPRSLEEARGCGLLIYDDLGQEAGGTDVAIEVMDARYRAGLPTIVTTWMTRDQLAERYGGGLTRRVLDRAGCFDWLANPKSERSR